MRCTETRTRPSLGFVLVPVLLGVLALSATHRATASITAYVVTTAGRVVSVDQDSLAVANPLSGAGSVMDVVADGKRLFLATTNGIGTFDIANGTYSSFPMLGFVNSIATCNGLLCPYDAMTGAIHFLDPLTKGARRPPLFAEQFANHTSANPAGTRLYVAPSSVSPGNNGSGQLSVHDAVARIHVATITLTGWPGRPAFNASSTRAYVPVDSSGRYAIDVLDLDDNTVVDVLPLDAGSVVLAPSGQLLYGIAAGQLHIIDTVTRALAAPPADLGTVHGFAAAVDPTDRVLYVLDSGSVVLYDLARNARIGQPIPIAQFGFENPLWVVVLSSMGDTPQVRSLINHYYRAILGREPEPRAEGAWANEASRMAIAGASAKEVFITMALAFFNSAEYARRNRDDPDFLLDVYDSFLHRAPDAGGYAYWLGRLQAGQSRNLVLLSFALSPEFEAYMAAQVGDTGRAEVYMVLDFYRGFLRRLPDPGGLDYWVGRFRVAQCESADAVEAEAEVISRAFLNASEYGARNRGDRQFVEDMYDTFMRRAGEAGGVEYWTQQIASHALTRDDVRRAFVRSSEFQNRVGAIIAAGCSLRL